MENVNLYVQVPGNKNPQVLLASGSPMAVVKAARDTLATMADDKTAQDMFGMRGFTAAGNPTASVRERFYASGLRSGSGFATGTRSVMVCAAQSVEQAEQLIAEAHVLLASAASMRTAARVK